MEGFQITLFLAVLVVDFPLHKPYPYSLYRFSDSLHFRYRPVTVQPGHYVLVAPTPLPEPKLIIHSPAMAEA